MPFPAAAYTPRPQWSFYARSHRNDIPAMEVLDFVRALNERPAWVKLLFRLVVGRFAYREFLFIVKNMRDSGYSPFHDYELKECAYHCDEQPWQWWRTECRIGTPTQGEKMNDAVLSINATLGERASKEAVGLENKVKASMRAVLKENFMETRDEALFRAGLGGALMDLGNDSVDGKRLLSSIEAMKRFSAMLTATQAGLSVDMSDVLPKEGEEMLPLMKWWHEVKDEK